MNENDIMKEMWDNRYADEEFAYGTEPNIFFEKALNDYNLKGDILLPGEGEGRNAVYAAKFGLNVTAFDFSKEGRKKALSLVKLNRVDIEYKVGEFSELQFDENSFDVIAIIYAHFSGYSKSRYHKQLSTYLKKDGIIILEGFSKSHFNNNNSSGPKSAEMLSSTEDMINDFPQFEILKLDEENIFLDEGKYHKGKCSVIRFIGKKIL